MPALDNFVLRDEIEKDHRLLERALYNLYTQSPKSLELRIQHGIIKALSTRSR